MKQLGFAFCIALGLQPLLGWAKGLAPADCTFVVTRDISFDARRSAEIQSKMIGSLCQQYLDMKTPDCKVDIPSKYLGRTCSAQTHPVYSMTSAKLLSPSLNKRFSVSAVESNAKLTALAFQNKIAAAREKALEAVKAFEDSCDALEGQASSEISTDTQEGMTDLKTKFRQSGEVIAQSRCISSDAIPEKISVALTLEFRK